MSKFVLTAQLQLQAPNNVAQVVSQMQRQLNNVKVDVQVKGAAAAQKDLKNVKAATDQATSSAHRMGKAFAVSIKRFAAFSIATRAVGLLTQGLGGAVSEAVKFERELIKVAQVTGKTVSQLSFLVKEINNLSTGMGVASASLLEVSRSLSQAGLSARDTKIALDALAKTELAPTFANITQTTEGAIAVMAQFKQGAGALEKQLGAINAVAGQFAVEAGDLISVIRRAGGVFKEAGGDLNELIGLFTSVRATTRESADSIATGLRTIFTRIQRPRTIEFMKQFGVELTSMDGKFVGAYEAVKRLSEALKGLEQGDIRFIKIAEELGGFRQIGKVIPLLKEFRVAEEARQAAIAGGDSLTRDAAAAQETLAVKIIKVKEEFLKLIREITQTTTFKLMADTALAFASSLIAIADAIKPLIPLITALMAFKMAKMFGGFGSGLASGMKNLGAGAPAAVNQGGRIRGLATGGYVPGQGSRDTVPAMLTPGEFVIKKSSVKDIGAEKLFSMNKYGGAGKVKGAKPIMLDLDPGAIAGFFLRPDQGTERSRKFSGQKIDITNKKVIDRLLRQKGPKSLKRQGASGVSNINAAAIAHGASLTREDQAAMGFSDGKKSVNAKALQGMVATDKNLAGDLTARYNADYKSGNVTAAGAPPVKVRGQMTGFFPGKGELKSNAEVNRIVAKRTQEALYNAVSNVAVEANSFLDIKPAIDFNDTKVKDAASRLSKDENVKNTVEGFVFEGLIQGITNAQLAGGGLRFDFPASSIQGNKKLLKNLFGNNPLMDKVVKGDAKRSDSPDSWKNIMNKLGSDINKNDLSGIAGFSKGGKSDTVPAMLTPGEFVFNKNSAQRIGYGALNQMNKKGVAGFAAGGPVGVQHFQVGGAPVPAGANPGAGHLQHLQTTVKALSAELLVLQGVVKTQNAGYFNATGALHAFARATAQTGIDTRAAQSIVWKERRQIEKANEITVKQVSEQHKLLMQAEVRLTAETKRVAAESAKSARGLIIVKKEETTAVRTNVSAMKRLTASTNLQAAGSAAAAGGAATAGRAMISAPLRMMGGGGGGNAQPQQTKLNQNMLRLTNETEKLLVSTTKLNVEEVELSVIMETLESGGRRLADVTNKQVLMLENHSVAVTNDTAAEQRSVVAVDSGSKSNIRLAKSSNVAAGSLDKVKGAGMGLMGPLIALQMIMAMIPTQINETDGALKMFAKTVGKAMMMLTTVAFMLVMFGSELSIASIATSLNTMAVNRQGAAFTQLFVSSIFGVKGNMMLASAANFAATAITKLGMKGLLGLAAVLVGLYAIGKTMSNLAKRDKESAIEEGKVDEAGTAAVNESLWGLSTAMALLATFIVTVLVAGLTVATGGMSLLIGAIAGVVVLFTKMFGLAGVIKDFFAMFGLGDTVNAIKLRAEADASAAKATKSLKTATEEAAEAMKDVAAGTKTATEALASTTIAEAYRDAGNALRAEAAAQTESSKGFWSKAWDWTKEIFTLGFADTSTDPMGATARLRTQTIAQTVKAGGIGKGSDALQAAQKSQGIKPEDIKAQKARIDGILKIMRETADLRARSAKEQIMKGTMEGMVDEFGDPVETSQMAFVAQQVNRMGAAFDALPLEEQKKVLKDLAKEYENQIKAVIDNTKRVLAMNFGLRGVEGAVGLATAKLENLSQAFDTGTVQVRASINKLNAILESGSAMDPAELKESLNAVNKELKGFGVDPRTADVLTKSFEALNAVQGSFRKTTENFMNSVMLDPTKASLSVEQFNNQLKDELRKSIVDQTGDKEGAKRIIDAMPKLTAEDVADIQGGDLSSIEDKFGEINEKLIRELEILSKIAELTEKVAEENKKRLDSEKALFDSQKKSIDLQKEAAKIIGEFGGVEFSAERKRELALSKANVGTGRSGLSNLRTGSVSEIRRRNEQIRGTFGAIQGTGRARVAGGQKFFGQGPRVQGGAFSSQGQEIEAQSNALKQAQEEQISTIRSLIQIEKEQLKTLEEKNRLEKESLDALLSGDVEAFMDKQAAAGATAAIASGDSRMAGLFGADAMAGAFSNLKRQKEAGVQSLFGQKLGGPGGMVERAGGMALSTRGIKDPRQAALLAGTTAKEEDSKRIIRGLAGELASTGELGADLAGMDLKTAEFRVQQATIIVSNAQQEAQKKSKESEDIRARGVDRGNKILERTEVELEEIADRNRRIEEIEQDILDGQSTPGSIYVHDSTAAKSMDNLSKMMTQRINDEGLAFASGAMDGPGKSKRNIVALNTATIIKGTEQGRKVLAVIAQATKDTYAATKGLVTGTFKGVKQGKGIIGSMTGGIRGGFGGAASSMRASQTGQALAGSRAGGVVKAISQFSKDAKAAFKGGKAAPGLVAKTSKAAAEAAKLGMNWARPSTMGSLRTSAMAGRTGRSGGVMSKMFGLGTKLAPETGMGKTGAFMSRWLNPRNFGWIKDLSKFGKDAKAAFSAGKGLGGFATMGGTMGSAARTGVRTSAMAGRTGKAGGFMGNMFDFGDKMRRGSQSVSKAFKPMTSAFTAARGGTAGALAGTGAMGKVGGIAGKVTASGVKSGALLARQLRPAASSMSTALTGSTGLAKRLGGPIAAVVKSPIGKFVGKALTPVAVALGGIAGVMEKDKTVTGTALEGGILGMITGSATKGDSMLSKVANWFGAGIEKGSDTDVKLGAIGGTAMAGLTGAAIGTMILPGIGTAIGAGIGLLTGALAEGWKWFTQDAAKDPIVVDAGGVSRTGGGVGGIVAQQRGPFMGRVLSTGEDGGATQVELSEDMARQMNRPVVDPAMVSQSQAQRQFGVTTGPVLPGGGGATPGGAIAQQAGAAGAAGAAGMSPEAMAQMAMSFAAGTERLAGALNKFNTDLASSITELKNLKFQVKLDTTNVNINFTGASFLETLSANIKTELLDHIVKNVIPSLKHDGAGNHVQAPGTGPAA